MKAIRLHRQGGPEQIVYEDAPEPVLVAVQAAKNIADAARRPAQRVRVRFVDK